MKTGWKEAIWYLGNYHFYCYLIILLFFYFLFIIVNFYLNIIIFFIRQYALFGRRKWKCSIFKVYAIGRKAQQCRPISRLQV